MLTDIFRNVIWFITGDDLWVFSLWKKILCFDVTSKIQTKTFVIKSENQSIWNIKLSNSYFPNALLLCAAWCKLKADATFSSSIPAVARFNLVQAQYWWWLYSMVPDMTTFIASGFQVLQSTRSLQDIFLFIILLPWGGAAGWCVVLQVSLASLCAAWSKLRAGADGGAAHSTLYVTSSEPNAFRAEHV